MASPTERDSAVLGQVRRAASLGVVAGLVIAAFGVVMLVWPQRTIVVVAALVGIALIIEGLARLLLAVSSRPRWPLVLSGLIDVVLGVVLAAGLFGTDRAESRVFALIALLIAAGWVLGGAIDLYGALRTPGTPARGWLVASGLLSLVAAVVILVWPLGTLTVLAIVVGLLLIALGLTRAWASWRLMRAAADVEV